MHCKNNSYLILIYKAQFVKIFINLLIYFLGIRLVNLLTDYHVWD